MKDALASKSEGTRGREREDERIGEEKSLYAVWSLFIDDDIGQGLTNLS